MAVGEEEEVHLSIRHGFMSLFWGRPPLPPDLKSDLKRNGAAGFHSLFCCDSIIALQLSTVHSVPFLPLCLCHLAEWLRTNIASGKSNQW